MSGALVMLLERAKQVVEPAGAASVAAIVDHPDRFAVQLEAALGEADGRFAQNARDPALAQRLRALAGASRGFRLPCTRPGARRGPGGPPGCPRAAEAQRTGARR